MAGICEIKSFLLIVLLLVLYCLMLYQRDCDQTNHMALLNILLSWNSYVSCVYSFGVNIYLLTCSSFQNF